jgi:prepilin-type N-terminal cleavage/methylation domain-containing protein
MKNPIHPIARKGFSLVELLVVIAIIAILAGASYPAITGAIKNAKITEGNKMAKDLVFAIDQFEQKYDYLPYPSVRTRIKEAGSDQHSSSSGNPDDYEMYITANGDLLRVLMGMDDDLNPNNTRFFEFKTAQNGVNGIIYEDDGKTPAAFVDPWGNPFVIVIDYTGERSIDFGEIPSLNNSDFSVYVDKNGEPLTIRSQSAVVASPGPDQQLNDEDDVKSW